MRGDLNVDFAFNAFFVERSVSTFMTHIQLEHIMMAKKQHNMTQSGDAKRDLKTEDSVELCFIHITFVLVPCFATSSEIRSMILIF